MTDKPRYSEDSTYNVHQQAVGNDPMHPKPWTNSVVDIVLDLWFGGAGIRTIARATSRTDKSIETLISKMFSKSWRNYKVATDYVPGETRVMRTGEWNEREVEAFARLDGRDSRIIGRSLEEVEIRKQVESGGFGIF